jgi:hypothetical protein
MKPINDGGPAFPVPDTYYPNGQVQYGPTGMSLRDWFAGHASEDDIGGYLREKISPKTGRKISGLSREEAKYAYADAMMQARSVADPAEGLTDGN